MKLPSFDIATALNLLAEGGLTLLGVLLGALLAFRLALKQVRRERAIDRRLQWYESMLSAFEQHRAAILERVRIDSDAIAGKPWASTLAADNAAWHAVQTGRDVQDSLAQSKLYAPPDIVRYCMDVQLRQLSVYPALLPDGANVLPATERIAQLTAHAKLLESAAVHVGSRVRAELDLGPITSLPPSPFQLPPAT